MSGSKSNDDDLEQTDELEQTSELSQASITKMGKRTKGTPEPYLLVIAGPAVGRMYKLTNREVTIGRSPEAEISIIDDGISRHHAAILHDGRAVAVRDLGSTNGIYVNGKKVSEKVLEVGDRVRIGSTTILKYSMQDELEESFQHQMYESAVRDSLTGTYNKRYFHDNLKTEFAYYSRHNLPLSLLMVDIDHFKRVNDSHGHLAGDHVLSEVAQVIDDGLRAEDILCRYGGEEFGVILRTTDAREALLVAERIRKTIAGHRFEFEAHQIKVSISIGISTLLDSNHDSPQKLIQAADKYLYAAKQAGRNRTACSEEHLKNPQQRRTNPLIR